MYKYITFGLALCAASPLQADNKYYRWTEKLPPVVERNLPADVPASDVVVQDMCFYYLYEGQVYKVPVSPTNEGPYCIG